MNESRLPLLPTIKRDALSPGFSKGLLFPVEVNSEIEEVQERTESKGEGTEALPWATYTSFPWISPLNSRCSSATRPQGDTSEWEQGTCDWHLSPCNWRRCPLEEECCWCPYLGRGQGSGFEGLRFFCFVF